MKIKNTAGEKTIHHFKHLQKIKTHLGRIADGHKTVLTKNKNKKPINKQRQTWFTKEHYRMERKENGMENMAHSLSFFVFWLFFSPVHTNR